MLNSPLANHSSFVGEKDRGRREAREKRCQQDHKPFGREGRKTQGEGETGHKLVKDPSITLIDTRNKKATVRVLRL